MIIFTNWKFKHSLESLPFYTVTKNLIGESLDIVIVITLIL